MSASPFQGDAQGAEWVPAIGRPRRTQGVLLIDSSRPDGPGERGLGSSCADDQRDVACNAVDSVAGEAASLERALPKGWRVAYAVHGGRPTIPEALELLRGAGVERVVVIPMRPQYVAAVTGSALAELYRCLGSAGVSDLHVEVRAWWHDDAGYIDAHARLIHACATENGLSPLDSVLVFVADGAAAERPETERLEETARLLLRRLGWPADRATLLAGDLDGPSLRDAAEELGADHGSRVLVCPITRMAAGGGLLRRLGALGVACHGEVQVCPSPGASEEFIKALALLVRRGRQPAADHGRGVPPLLEVGHGPDDVAAEVGTLVMVGVCMDSTLGRVGGPVLRHCSRDELKEFKRPHLETVALLKRMGQSGLFRECWVWNTCSRYEFYAWLPAGASRVQAEAAAARAVEDVFGPAAAGRVNVLRGREAWRHALRTAAGLNSVLVGDAEVADQLQAARCAAHLAGTTGALTGAFMRGIAKAVGDLRGETAWGRYAHRYCDVALDRLAPRLGPALSSGQCLVIGGSTTACSVLETLSRRFGVPRERVSLIYRGFRKGTLARRLNSAAGPGRVSVVGDYGDPKVLRALAATDAVFFTLDQRQSVVFGAALAAMRDLMLRPLKAVDFNTFASVADSAGIPGLDVVSAAEIDAEIGRFNAAVLGDAGLGAAVAEAERWIASHVDGAAAVPGPRGGRGANRRAGKEVAL